MGEERGQARLPHLETSLLAHPALRVIQADNQRQHRSARAEEGGLAPALHKSSGYEQYHSND